MTQIQTQNMTQIQTQIMRQIQTQNMTQIQTQNMTQTKMLCLDMLYERMGAESIKNIVMFAL